MSQPVMRDVRTTSHGTGDDLYMVLREVEELLKSQGYVLVGIVAQDIQGVNVFRAPGVSFAFTEAVMTGLERAGLMKDLKDLVKGIHREDPPVAG